MAEVCETFIPKTDTPGARTFLLIFLYSCQNPSLTYMAITARAANYAIEELKKGNL